jgi:hypothetical protein
MQNSGCFMSKEINTNFVSQISFILNIPHINFWIKRLTKQVHYNIKHFCTQLLNLDLNYAY